MPKYDESTLKTVLRKVRLMEIASDMSRSHMIDIDYWDDEMEEYYKGMKEGYNLVKEVCSEMLHTTNDEQKKEDTI